MHHGRSGEETYRLRILVTGNLGYVGPVAVRHFRRVFPRAELFGFDNAYFAHCLTQTWSFPERHLRAQYFGDVREISGELLRGVDAVVHLAAVSNDPMGDQFAQVTDEINHRSSLRLATLCRDAGVRSFVFASSCSVYGSADSAPRSERDPVAPLTAYAKSKISTEQELERMNLGDMVVTCLRFATACGDSPRLRLDLVLNDFVASSIATGKVEVLSDGTPWRPLIHVEDMARAFEWGITRARSEGGRCLVVNAGSDEWNFRIRDLAAAVAAEVSGTEVSINDAAPPDKRSYRVDFSLFRKLAPRHQPAVTLASAVSELHASLTHLGFGDTEFRVSDKVRLNALVGLVADGLLDSDLRWTSA